MRFDDVGYVDAFRQTGEYPDIHDKVAHLLLGSRSIAGGETVLDLGACTGLISRRALALGYGYAVAVEPRNYPIKLTDDRIEWHHFAVGPDTTPLLRDLLRTTQPKVVIARRVFPEIDLGSPGYVREVLSGLLHEHGVERIVFEGRVPNARAKTVLASVHAELEALEGHWKVRNVLGLAATVSRR